MIRIEQNFRFDLEREIIKEMEKEGWIIKNADPENYSDDTDINWIASKWDTIAILTIVQYRIKRDHILNSAIGREDFAADHAVIIALDNKLTEIAKITAEGLNILVLTPDEVPYFASSA